MSTPYWGQLPGPKIHRRLSESGEAAAVLDADDANRTRPPPASDSTPTTANSHRQNPNLDSNSHSDSSIPSAHLDPSPVAARSGGTGPTVAPDAAQPLQAPHPTQSPQELPPPQRRRSKRLQKLPHQVPKMNNRASLQTTVTDSTYTYDEPETPSFQPQGLAPRPPSYIRGGASGHQGSSGMQHSSSRRRSRQPDDYDDFATSTPPAAPEVPRGPPTSYRAPYGNGGAYQYTAAGGASGPPEEYYARGGDSSAAAAPRPQPGAADVPLNVSLGSTSDRRKVFADDRSPLQRLELTLGSYTKEEKRARVEAAERRARERAAIRAGLAPPTTAPEDPTPDRRVSSGRYDAQTSRQEAPQSSATAPVPAVAAAPLPQQEDLPRDNSHRRSSHRRGQPSQSYGERAIPPPNADRPPEAERYDDAKASGIPTRNLSFRERAAKDHTELPAPPQEQVYGQQEQASTSGGLSLSRNGSNKLRKHPPGDPWYHQRMEAERAIPSVTTRIPQPKQRLPPREQAAPPSQDDRLPINPPTAVQPDDYNGTNRHRTALGAAAAGTAAGTAVAAGSRSAPQRQNEDPLSPYESDEKYMPTKTKRKDLSHWGYEPPESQRPPPGVEAARRQLEGEDSSDASNESLRLEQEAAAYGHPEQMSPGKGRYQPPEWLNEWEKATVGTLTGQLLDPTAQPDTEADLDKSKAWWEGNGGSRRTSASNRPRRAEAFDGEYDESSGAATRFKPALYLKCGPLIRYCGIRHDRVQSQVKGASLVDRELWRGSIMIVTRDAESSYEIAPTLRLFLQDLDLLPPPPHHVDGDLPSEYVDPIAGHPKLGRRGETLYVRPVEHLQEAKDLSKDETDEGLFESTRSTPDGTPAGASSASHASRRARVRADGEKMQKYRDIRGFRLHAERGCTFWRFNIEIELREQQQHIAYRINRGPAMGFWVPPQGQTMNMMFYSCNGFSLAAKPDDFSGPDPMWRDVLNNHQTRPFHVMIGGGDQIYNDCVADQSELFGDWLDISNLHHKNRAPFTPEMQDELEDFYLERYCSWFSQGLFSVATSQIPMVNMFDDHDIFDGYGSYADREMSSPVLCGLGAVAFKYYMLFQQQSIIPESEKTEPSLIMGLEKGPYINELSRSLYVSMGSKVSLLAVDARTERTELEVMSSKTWEKIMNRLYAEVRRGHVEHLLVLLGVPIAYPRLVWLENILTSRLLDPVKALGKTGFLGKSLNNIDGGAEVLDDLNDHWTAKNHKHERALVIEDLQDLAIDKSLRVTILSGDVHLAAVGQFYSNPKLGLAKHKDPRYMPNIISSAIANAPPPDLMADVLNKRNKVHHFDKQTDEDMIPMFQHGPDGKPRNNKRLLPHRNWCSIRQWNPGSTPPPTPPPEDHEDRSPSPERPSRGPMGLIRRLSRSRSQSGRPDLSRDSVRGPRPPISGTGGGGFFRSLSRRRGSTSEAEPKKLRRTMSLGRDDAPKKPGGFFGSLTRRLSQSRRPDDGGINGQWGGEESEDDDYYYGDPREYGDPRMQASHRPPQPSGLRGGGVQDEYSEGDEDYFTAQPPRRAQTLDSQGAKQGPDFPPTRPFHRTPTGLSTKQKKQADNYEVDLEGGLDICLNVEVNPKDPTGITVPYRLLVPKLFYEWTPGDDEISTPPVEKSSGGGRFKKLLSFRRKPVGHEYIDGDEDSSQDEEEDYGRR